jgi:hemerythrin
MAANEPMMVELFNMMNTVLKKLDSLSLTIEAVETSLQDHMRDEEKEIERITTTLHTFTGAFPDGDPHGHRAYHDAVISRIKKRADFYEKMTLALGEYGLIGFTGWLLYVVWSAFLQGPHK